MGAEQETVMSMITRKSPHVSLEHAHRLKASGGLNRAHWFKLLADNCFFVNLFIVNVFSFCPCSAERDVL